MLRSWWRSKLLSFTIFQNKLFENRRLLPLLFAFLYCWLAFLFEISNPLLVLLGSCIAVYVG
jgi:hypothetical protein